MAGPAIQTKDNGIVFTAKIVPGSRKTQVCGLLDTMIKIKVAAAPEKGKANACLVQFLAKLLGIRKQDVQVVSGHAHPVKQIHIRHITPEALRSALHIPGGET